MTINQKGVVVLTHGNQDIQKYLFLILILCSSVYAAEVEEFSYIPEAKVLVSDTEIVAGNTIRLKIRANGDKVVFPNIEEIDGVPVLEQHEIVVNRPHYINGVLKKERTLLILTFAPHQDVTIPSYEVGIDGKMYKTKAIKIKVIPMNAQNREDSNKFFLHLQTDKKTAIVGEAILVTVHFSIKNGVRLSTTPQYTQPIFKGFFSKIVADEKVFAEGNRQITELKYLLTPQLEGQFNVGPAKIKIGVPNKSKLDMFGRVVGTIWIPLVSNTVKIKVTKKPKESDIMGHFSIENSLDSKNVKVNKPVNLTINISGEGTLEDFEFPDFDIDGVTVYSDDAQINTELNNNIIHSTYNKSFVFISDRNFTIPSRRISVYDSESNSVKYLETSSYNIHVEGSKIQAMQKPQAQISHAGKVYNNLNSPRKSMLDTHEEYALAKVQSAPWWMVILAFVLGLLLMYIWMYVKWKKKTHTVTELEALKILYAFTNESQEIENMVRQLYAKQNGDESIIIDETTLKMLVEKYKIKHKGIKQ